MADIINLRQARKARKRQEDAHSAEQSRIKHGRTKGEKQHAEISRQKFDEMMDGVRREPTDE